MPESARQLLEGIARALADDVSPHVSDRFAQMQCKAAAELLGNLAAELDWAPGPLEARNDELRDIVAALQEVGWPGQTPALADASGQTRGPADAPGQLRLDLLDHLGAGMRWLADQPAPVRERIDGMLRDDLDRQVAALRRGMFR
jgi:hypothetical protein